MRRLNVININTPTGSVRFLRLPPAVMDARITEPSVDIYLEIVRLRTGFHGRQRLYGRLGHFDLHHLSRPRQRGTHTDMGLRRSKRGAANTSTFSQGETRRRRGRQPKHTESAFKNPPPRKWDTIVPCKWATEKEKKKSRLRSETSTEQGGKKHGSRNRALARTETSSLEQPHRSVLSLCVPGVSVWL